MRGGAAFQTEHRKGLPWEATAMSVVTGSSESPAIVQEGAVTRFFRATELFAYEYKK